MLRHILRIIIYVLFFSVIAPLVLLLNMLLPLFMLVLPRKLSRNIMFCLNDALDKALERHYDGRK